MALKTDDINAVAKTWRDDMKDSKHETVIWEAIRDRTVTEPDIIDPLAEMCRAILEFKKKIEALETTIKDVIMPTGSKDGRKRE